MTYNVPPPPTFFGGYGGARQGDTIADLLARRGEILAEGARRSGDIWGGTIGNIAGIATGALAKHDEQQQQARLGSAMSEAMGPGTTTRTPGQDVNGDPTADTVTKPPDIQAILGKMPPEERQKAAASIQAVATQAQTFQQHQLEIEKTRGELKAQDDASKQHLANVVGTFGLGIEQHLQDPDGGILLAHSGLDALSNAKVPVDRLQPFAAQAFKAYSDAANDPQRQAQIVDAWRQQVGPMIQAGKATMTPEAQKSFADTQKALAESHKPTDVAPGHTLLAPGTTTPIYTAPTEVKPETRSIPEQIAAATLAGDTATVQKLTKAAQTAAAATRDPEAAAARLEARKNSMDAKDRDRYDKSYNTSTTQLDALGKPLADQADKFAKLQAAVNQKTPQADALVAPELLSVMAGGSGSGLRMNEAEISRIVGGRSNFDNIKVALQKWDPRDGKALTITDEQRAEINKLVAVVHDRLASKVDTLNEARNSLLDEGTVEGHRRIMATVKTKLGGFDSPGGAPGAPTEVTATGPGGQQLVLRNGQWVLR